MEKWTKITDTTNWVLPLDRKLIDLCDKVGYIAIAVCMEDACVKESMRFGFGVENSVFTEPGKTYKQKYPAIWGIIDDMGIAAGAGNTQQKQLLNGHNLTKACYKKEKNEWYYKLHPDTVKEVGMKFGV